MADDRPKATRATKVDVKKSFDISRPGKAAPAATAKPIIVSNRPVLKDPMVLDSIPDELDTEAKSSSPSSASIKIEPLDEKPAEKPVEMPKEPVKAEAVVGPELAPTDDQAVHEGEEEPAPPEAAAKPAKAAQSSKAAEPEDKKPAKENTATDDAADEGAAKPKPVDASKAEAEAKAAAEHQQKIDKLVESRQYFLPINAVQKRRTRHHVLLGLVLIVLLGLAWVDVSLDAGIFKISGIHPLTHFFSR